MHKCLDFSDKMDIIVVTPPGDTPITHRELTVLSIEGSLQLRYLQGYPKGMQIVHTSNSFR